MRAYRIRSVLLAAAIGVAGAFLLYAWSIQ